MTSGANETGRPDEEAAKNSVERESHAAAAGHSENAAGAPPADFDPAEHPSNPDLVADDEPPDR